jgi:hypothetical protein
LWNEIIGKNPIMENLQFLTDHQDHRLAVVINFKEHLELWQTIYDRLILESL